MLRTHKISATFISSLWNTLTPETASQKNGEINMIIFSFLCWPDRCDAKNLKSDIHWSVSLMFFFQFEYSIQLSYIFCPYYFGTVEGWIRRRWWYSCLLWVKSIDGLSRFLPGKARQMYIAVYTPAISTFAGWVGVSSSRPVLSENLLMFFFL